MVYIYDSSCQFSHYAMLLSMKLLPKKILDKNRPCSIPSVASHPKPAPYEGSQPWDGFMFTKS